MAKKYKINLSNKSFYNYKDYNGTIACEELNKKLLEYVSICEAKNARKKSNKKYWKDVYEQAKLTQNKLRATELIFTANKSSNLKYVSADFVKLSKLKLFMKGNYLRLSRGASKTKSSAREK